VGRVAGCATEDVVTPHASFIALDNRAIQRDFSSDPVSWAAKIYLSLEKMWL
jgi:hypothetical protein